MAALGGLCEKLTCRLIEESDLDGVIDCLRRGFPNRSRDYWALGLARLAARPPIEGYPEYGYALVRAGQIVGVMLMIFSRHGEGEAQELRCNLSSWCVDPEYRAYGSRLAFAAIKYRNVTFTNVSPTEETWPVDVAAACGFRRFCHGQFVFLPAALRPRPDDRVLEFRDDLPEAAALSAEERRILAEHAGLGCLSLVGVTDGESFPLVLQQKRLLNGRIRARQIVYCRSLSDLPRISGGLGRFLLRRGVTLCVADANGRIEGLYGHFFRDRGPKYFRGPTAPKLGDLAYSEFVFFGG